MSFSKEYIKESIDILSEVDASKLDVFALKLSSLRSNGGRLFVLGLGGSFSTGIHLVNDLIKLCHVEAYAPENISLLTAEINDNGFETCYLNYIKGCNITSKDAIFVLSVGGGAKKGDKLISAPLVKCVDYCNEIGSEVYGIIGKEEGYVNSHATACLVVPNKYPERLTPHLEGLTSVLLHLLITHPDLSVNATTW